MMVEAPTVPQSSVNPPRGSSFSPSLSSPPSASSRLRRLLSIPQIPTRFFLTSRGLCKPGLPNLPTSTSSFRLSSNANDLMASFQVLLTCSSHPGDLDSLLFSKAVITASGVCACRSTLG